MADINEVFKKTDAAEKAHGLPSGTLRAIMHNEIRNSNAYLDEPDKYHYPVAADGKHRTKDGVQSSAFGPFGILDSTAQKPGYGITPLKDKSLDEQVRFTAETLSKTSQKLGGLDKALDLYGGNTPGYTQKVLANIANPERIAVKGSQAPIAVAKDESNIQPKDTNPGLAQSAPVAPVIAQAPVAPVVQEKAIQQLVPVIAQAPIVKEVPVPVAVPIAKNVNPMEEMQAAEPITPEALQYAQAAVPKQPSLYEMMDAYGAESPVATVTPMRSLQQMAQLQQSQNIRKAAAAAAAANLGEGLAPVDTRVAGTNEQLAQIQQENRPMATFNNILANQRAEAMNYG